MKRLYVNGVRKSLKTLYEYFTKFYANRIICGKEILCPGAYACNGETHILEMKIF